MQSYKDSINDCNLPGDENSGFTLERWAPAKLTIEHPIADGGRVFCDPSVIEISGRTRGDG